MSRLTIRDQGEQDSMRWLFLVSLLLAAPVGSAQVPETKLKRGEVASPLLMGDGPKRLKEGADKASSRKGGPGEFVLNAKYMENQYFRDAFHGWSTGEGMWRGLTPNATKRERPAKKAMKGTFNPAADFLTLLEAGWLTRAQIAEGVGMQQQHERVIKYARARLAAVQHGGNADAIRHAQRTLSDLDRKHYLEKRAFMEGLRKELRERRPDLLCVGVNCTVAGGSGDGANRPNLPPPPTGLY